jgi:hypothetical protein
MKNIPFQLINKKVISLLMLLSSFQFVNAQDDKVKFSAVARALQLNNTLAKTDTLNPDNTSTGNVMLDLGININPDKKTEIQGIIRFNNNIGGFYGSDAKATLRQLCVKGIIGNFLNYQVGDLYLQLTPYTFFNNHAEGNVNEATIFKDIRRDYTNYENFSHRGNAWWQQGVHTNMALAINGLYFDTLRFDAFFLRNRSTDFSKLPSTFHAGGKVTLSKSNNTKIAVNYLDLFDLDFSDQNKNLKRNPVTTFELNQYLKNNAQLSLKLVAEAGTSMFIDSVANINGFFYDAGLQLQLKPQNLRFGANFNYVDPYFYSAAAQSKRVNFGKSPFIFPSFGNNPNALLLRAANLYDLVSDASIYNASIVRTLMPYNLIFGNATPYGKATPNRTGIELNTQYSDSAQSIVADISVAYLSNIVGEGTSALRHFLVFKAGLNLDIHQYIHWKKQIKLTSGFAFEATNRGGAAVQQINFTNQLLDLGISIETIKKLDFLLGYKSLQSKGNEFIAIRNSQNEIINYFKIDKIDVFESVFSVGLKYRFSNASYLTFQNALSTVKDNTKVYPTFSFNQFMILFNLNF